MDQNIARTLAVLREMAKGKTLNLGNYTFGMTEDMAIGVILYKLDNGEAYPSGISEMTLSAFHAVLNRQEVGMVIFND